MIRRLKSCFLIGVLGVAAFAASAAHAGTTTTYTSRTAFEAALASHTVDDLTGIPQFQFHGTISRPGYTLTTPDMWGCINQSGCNNNAARGFDSAYLWNYSADDTFTFATAVNGFGFDFNSPVNQASVSAKIDGIITPAIAGFYGVIYSEARTTFTVGQNNSFMLMDNITFGRTPAPVPEPAPTALFGIALAALALSRRPRKK